MRLDKFICESTGLTRSQAGKVIRQGVVTLNGDTVKQAALQVSTDDVVCLDDQQIKIIGLRYIMLHKPAGYICSTSDPDHPTVLLYLKNPC